MCLCVYVCVFVYVHGVCTWVVHGCAWYYECVWGGVGGGGATTYLFVKFHLLRQVLSAKMPAATVTEPLSLLLELEQWQAWPLSLSLTFSQQSFRKC
jgi:hypothetical protein